MSFGQLVDKYKVFYKLSRHMISSKDLIQRAGISRATLNNYISLGLLSKPEIRSGEQGERILGYFPEQAIERVAQIQELKAQGLSMAEIRETLTRSSETTAALAPTAVSLAEPSMGTARSYESRHQSGGLQLTLDEVSQPAFMFNYRFELVWFNEPARQQLLGGFAELPALSDERHILPMIDRATRGWPGHLAEDFLRATVGLVRPRLGQEAIQATCRQLPVELQTRIMNAYQEAPEVAADPSASKVMQVDLPDSTGRTTQQQLIATYFREGILVVCSPFDDRGGSLAQFLSRRDVVIRHLLKKRLPVLTPLAVLVADLQGSTRICSELPPEEYFELINEIWAEMEPIFRKYFGTHGKHVGDGMLYYFFPQPDSHYVFNAIRCADEMREAIRQVNARWQLKKGWLNELLLNIGLNEGTEWLGTFQTATSIEFSVLGDTINQASRLSDFARHGTIWATKGLLGKLSPQEKSRLRFGVTHQAHDGRQVFVESSFAQADTLVDLGRHEKLKDLVGIAVTEIQQIRA